MKARLKNIMILIVITAATVFAIYAVYLSLSTRYGCLLVGTLLLAFGSVVQSEEWKKGKRIRAIAFVIAITLGGLATTRAWNLFAGYKQKKAIITAVARDWKINDAYLQISLFVSDSNDILSKHISYPKFRANSLAIALTSGAFNTKRNADLEMLKAVARYDALLSDLQDYLDMTDEGLYVAFAGRQPLKQHRRVQKSEQLAVFRKAHNTLGKLLMDNYKWVFEEPFLPRGKEDIVSK